ncbi:MAG TPA: S1C family serine protease [Actinomycetota bacterium]|nr:S1C family serine protease [Actinomycetota bacterium]
MAALEELEQATRSVAERVGPSVVGIGARWGRGSGVVVAVGKVLTNSHNVRSTEVTVSFADGRTVEGTVAGADEDGDLAVISVDTGGTPAVTWSEGEVGLGKLVFALANPGGRGLRVTHGFVSGVERSFRGPRGRRIAGSLEHTAPLARGSSGGPIVDAEGRLLGLNTNRAGEGFYLAVPADRSLRDRVEALGRGDVPAAPRLGVAVAPPWVARRMRRAVGLEERDGLMVRAVAEGSPAAAAGLRQGDLIVAAGGSEVGSADDLFEALDRAGAGGTVQLTVIRGDEERTVSVSLTRERPASEEA